MAKTIYDNNLLYNILNPLVRYATRCHYRHFVVRGKENLPTDGPYIIAPCHQQALMEPLAVLRISPKPPVFLARADIFRRPAIRAILMFLRILPVYRIRDGQESLGRNQAIFDQCRDTLLARYPLCLMAEGRHNNRHRLLPLRKGMFRIAGETQVALGDQPLYIVPTGIDFDVYERPYSNVVVNIGKPIPVQPFMETYRDNEPLALNQMREALNDALLPLMHDIRDEEHYDEIMTLSNVMNKEMRRHKGLKNSAWNRFRMRQKMSTSDFSTHMFQSADTLRQQCQRLHLDEKLLSEHWSLAATLFSLVALVAALAVVVAVPVVRWTVLFCLLCYPIALIPTHLVVRKKIADPQFRSSFDFGVRLVFSMLYSIIIAVVMACCGGGWMSRVADIGAWWGLVAVAAVFFVAAVTGPLVSLIRDVFANCRYWLLRLFRRHALREIDKTMAGIREKLFLPVQ